MDLQTFIQSAVVGGGATSLATELLKSKYIPVQAQKYPRITAAIVSVVASGIFIWHTQAHPPTSDWKLWVALAAATLITAADTYNHILK